VSTQAVDGQGSSFCRKLAIVIPIVRRCDSKDLPIEFSEHPHSVTDYADVSQIQVSSLKPVVVFSGARSLVKFLAHNTEVD